MRKLLLALIAVWCIVPSSAASADWTEVRTRHYLFLGDATRYDMRRIAQRFEQFHGVMQQLLSRESVSFAAPTVVLVFKDLNSFRPFLPLYDGKTVERAGIALTGGDVNYVALYAQGGDAAFPIVFHELAHLITRNVSQIPALWFIEGIAEYYSSFEMRGEAAVVLGRPIANHVALLRQQFMPIPELLAVDHTSAAYNERSRSSVFYAESWALVHYLRFNPATRERVPHFMRLVERGTPQDQAIAEAFGMDLATPEKALRGYVRRFTMSAERAALDDRVTAATVTMSESAEAVALPHLINVQWRVGRTAEAEQRLQAAVKQLPRSAALHAVLAQLRIEEGRSADALAALSRDLSYDGFLDNYLAGSALARYVSRIGPENAASAVISSLKQRASAATGARNDVPEAWRLASVAHLLADDVKEAGAAIARAIALAPANERYQFTQIDILVRQRDFLRARSLLGTLMAHGSTAEIRTEARQTMGRVVEYERAVTRADAREHAAESHSPDTRAPEPSRASSHPGSLPAFRDPEADETRVFGALTAIECSPGGVTMVIRSDGSLLRITAAAFEAIDFISFRHDLSGQVTCRARVPPDPVYVTWRGPDNPSGKVQTDAITVEFTPRGYTPK